MRSELKIWLDDVRKAPEGWTWVRTSDEAIGLLQDRRVSEISLDHDLGDESESGSGYLVVLWIERMAIQHGYVPPEMIHIHSANPVGRKRMQMGIDSMRRHLERDEQVDTTKEAQ